MPRRGYDSSAIRANTAGAMMRCAGSTGSIYSRPSRFFTCTAVVSVTSTASPEGRLRCTRRRAVSALASDRGRRQHPPRCATARNLRNSQQAKQFERHTRRLRSRRSAVDQASGGFGGEVGLRFSVWVTASRFDPSCSNAGRCARKSRVPFFWRSNSQRVF